MIAAAARPAADDAAALVQIRTESAGPVLLKATAPTASGAVRPAAQVGLAACELCTTVVNASCASRTHLPQYLIPGTMHAFEPRGAVSVRDRYQVGREIGRGAYGTVLAGRCLQSGRPVALKRVRLLLAAREHLHEEVAILREVRSPHVVALLNYIEEGVSMGCLVMELLPGGDLYSQVLARYGWAEPNDAQHDAGPAGYSERDVREILRMALSGLAAIHDHNVVHRDLKPENVLLLDRRGGLLDLRIADFGVARRLGPSRTVMTQAGTRGYMAPEVLSGEAHGQPVDIWSLGVILFTLLCGRLPFNHEDEAREEAAVRFGRWSFADPNWDEVSVEAKGVVRQFLSQDSHARPRAHEALDLPWLRPDTDATLAQASARWAASRPAARPAGHMARNASLPGSASLLQLRALEQRKHARVHEREDDVPPPVAGSLQQLQALEQERNPRLQVETPMSPCEDSGMAFALPAASAQVRRTPMSASPKVREHGKVSRSVSAANVHTETRVEATPTTGDAMARRV